MIMIEGGERKESRGLTPARQNFLLKIAFSSIEIVLLRMPLV
jgi:hypothetical protein